MRRGIELGMTLIDTAEMYGGGASEQVVGQAIAGARDAVFIVTKVLPSNASRKGTVAACERSLKHLGIETIDLYLLHWRGGVPLARDGGGVPAPCSRRERSGTGASRTSTPTTWRSCSRCRREGAAPPTRCCNHPGTRGIEFDLLPWCAAHEVPVMAYSPIGQAGRLLRAPSLVAIAGRHGATPAQIAIAWSLRRPGIISIPKAGDLAHVAENAAAADIALTAADLAEIDRAFPPPDGKQSLDML